MSIIKKPEITEKKLKKHGHYTKISFIPDFKLFKLEGIDEEVFSMLKKRVYDIAGTMPFIDVYFNDI